jgi:hypothetical protein
MGCKTGAECADRGCGTGGVNSVLRLPNLWCLSFKLAPVDYSGNLTRVMLQWPYDKHNR